MKNLTTLIISCFFVLSITAQTTNTVSQIVDIDPIDYPVLCGQTEQITQLLVIESSATNLTKALSDSERWSDFIAV